MMLLNKCFRICCYPLIYIYHSYIFIILYMIISIADLLSIIFSSLYFVKCDLINSQKTALIIFIILSFVMMLRRYLIMSGHYKVYNNYDFSCEKNSKCILFMIPSLVLYIGNLMFYNKLDLEKCNNISSNKDNLVFILIFGIISSIMELDHLYNIWHSIINRDNNRIRPIIEDEIEIITINPNIEIINKINNKDIINGDCNICLEEDNNIIKLDCNHNYHKECIIKWINQEMNRSKSCPICRQNI